MRPHQYWIAFLACLVVVLAAMGWVSVMALRLDRSQAEAQQRAAFEENVRLCALADGNGAGASAGS